jgi:hypothetical protein
MKTLLQYIIEARTRISLPFSYDELYDVCKDRDMVSIREFANKYLGKYGHRVVSVFVELLGIVTGEDLSKRSIRKFYDRIQSMPVDRLNITGYGSEGFVYDIGNDIIKIYYSGKLPDDVMRLAELSKRTELYALPKIKRSGKSWIMRENYKTNTKKVKDFYTILFGSTEYDMYDYPEDCIYSKYLDGETYDKSGYTDDEKEVIDWLDSLDYELREFVGPKYSADRADLTLKNLGESKDGRIVLFDW